MGPLTLLPSGLLPLPLPLLLLLIFASPALAILTGDQSPPASARDPEFAAGVTAWRNENWPAVIEHLARVIERRPWHDDAHSLLGFAYRRLADFDRALAHYQKALELNPYNRGALEYLGEAYLQMGRPEQAETTLERLAKVCSRIADDTSETAGQASGCEEWRMLKNAIAVQRQAAPPEGTQAGRAGGWSALDTDALTELDTVTTRVSDRGLYRVSYRSELAPPGINKIHSWVLHLETLDGRAVENVDIEVTGGMPEHDHGLPTTPRVTRYLGGGEYLVEGMKFQMGGWWVVNFAFETDRRTDTVTFNLVL
jgi:tetratricopeptide (TPR) repeat protein